MGLLDGPELVWWIILGLGAYYLPMAMLAVVLFDSVLAINPVTVVSAILKVPIQYTILFVVLAAVVALSYLVETLVADAWPIVEWLLAGFLSIYEGALVMRAIGLLYRAHEQQIGWFYRAKGTCRNCGYDLRGTAAAAAGTACPECGTPVTAAAAAQSRPRT